MRNLGLAALAALAPSAVQPAAARQGSLTNSQLGGPTSDVPAPGIRYNFWL